MACLTVIIALEPRFFRQNTSANRLGVLMEESSPLAYIDSPPQQAAIKTYNIQSLEYNHFHIAVRRGKLMKDIKTI